jgi:hypothetical protein
VIAILIGAGAVGALVIGVLRGLAEILRRIVVEQLAICVRGEEGEAMAEAAGKGGLERVVGSIRIGINFAETTIDARHEEATLIGIRQRGARAIHCRVLLDHLKQVVFELAHIAGLQNHSLVGLLNGEVDLMNVGSAEWPGYCKQGHRITELGAAGE